MTVCALGLLAAPGPGAAHAAPDEPPKKRSLESVRAEIEELHDRAGSATDAYNAADERATAQRRQVRKLSGKLRDTRRTLDKLTNTAGAMARAQYRGGGLPDEARLMLGRDPERFLHNATIARKGQQATRGFLARLRQTRAELDDDSAKATRKGKALEAERARKAAARKKITAQLKRARKLERSLEADELKRMRELDEKEALARHAKWLKTGALEQINAKASRAGKRAIAYATEQLGKDYEWGAEGPTTFDCSGLTLRAWEAAGETIPRTSQEQWKRLPRVPLKKMRPGDLIIYKKDASHVGIYVGKGEMLHAPRTGRTITVEGAGSLPILGVVRPDK
ncbi:glycoside hydrolase [Streptomyces sp. AJS327]|nr:glycoside hydrolase [Streptomyces sp. AJS327]